MSPVTTATAGDPGDVREPDDGRDGDWDDRWTSRCPVRRRPAPGSRR